MAGLGSSPRLPPPPLVVPPNAAVLNVMDVAIRLPTVPHPLEELGLADVAAAAATKPPVLPLADCKFNTYVRHLPCIR
jgi:hypothetical protein